MSSVKQQQQKITSCAKKWESMIYSKSTEYFSEKDQMIHKIKTLKQLLKELKEDRESQENNV